MYLTVYDELPPDGLVYDSKVGLAGVLPGIIGCETILLAADFDHSREGRRSQDRSEYGHERDVSDFQVDPRPREGIAPGVPNGLMAGQRGELYPPSRAKDQSRMKRTRDQRVLPARCGIGPAKLV